MKKLFFFLLFVTSALTSVDTIAQEADFRPRNQTEISLTDLPSQVRSILDAKEYDGWKTVGVYRSDAYDASGSNARYLIRLQYEVEFKDVYLDGAGLAYNPD